MDKKTKLYLFIAFAWTWCGWIMSYWISHLQGGTLSMDGTIFTLWTESWGSQSFLPQFVFALSVYGPLIGFLVVGDLARLRFNAEGSRRLGYYILLVPLVSATPTIIMSLASSYFQPSQSAFSLIAGICLYFVSNLMTSGTEEFGWRGQLYPDMKRQGLSFWDIAWKGGLIWAAWHLPLMMILYMPLGLAVLVPSLVGFTASIVAMNYITNFIYEGTQNIWFVAVLHALNNTVNFMLVLLFPGTPFTILTSLMAWAIVWWIEKKHLEVVG